MSAGELDERQEALHRIDTQASRPMRMIEPSRHKWRKTRWERFGIWLRALLRLR
jgi:hypothetical protein